MTVADHIGSIFQEREHSIVTETSAMKKVSDRLVPKLLTSVQTHARHNMSRDNLALFEADLERLLQQFVTLGETWVLPLAA